MTNITDNSIGNVLPTLETLVAQKERDMRELFPAKSGVNIESLIRSYHSLHELKVYRTRPANVLGPKQIVK